MNLRPVADPARFYVLASQLPVTTPTGVCQIDLAVGVAAVEVPSYLLDRRIAVARATHELTYLDNDRWAERLDKSTQRVIAANLEALLPSDRVSLSAWRREDVGAEVYVSIRTFEIDEDGQILLEAHWRITSPGGEKTWRADHLLVTRKGPSFRADPHGVVGVLSTALADVSAQIAGDLRTGSMWSAASTTGPP
jgi:uncharacterized lipoprotein YmbA